MKARARAQRAWKRWLKVRGISTLNAPTASLIDELTREFEIDREERMRELKALFDDDSNFGRWAIQTIRMAMGTDK